MIYSFSSSSFNFLGGQDKNLSPELCIGDVKLNIEIRKIEKLKYYPGNPRKISGEMLENLKKSIKEFGMVDPLIINKDNEVIGGNQRLRAAIEEGLAEVPVVTINLTKEKERALNLALNKIQGEWDNGLLVNFVKELSKEEINLTGFTESELYMLDWDSRLDETRRGNLSKELLYPPFTVLDTKIKRWRDLRVYWDNKYGDNLTETKNYLLSGGQCMMTALNKGTSKFDPVLAQIIYKWFMPFSGGMILNPTCGEPTTGIVAGELGFGYLGIDIRQEQVDINNRLARQYKFDKVEYLTFDSTKLNEKITDRKFDLVFYSPPYYGIEVYSFDIDDISVKGEKQGYSYFMEGFEKIIMHSANLLKDNRFYVIKLGDVREIKGKDKGILLNFLGDTINVASKYGLKYYNDLILATAIGTAPFRARNLFGNRKIVRTHQRVLIFYKGDFSEIQKEFPLKFSEEELKELVKVEGEEIDLESADIES